MADIVDAPATGIVTEGAAESGPAARRRSMARVVATLAMGSWVLLAAMPVAVLIAALT